MKTNDVASFAENILFRLKKAKIGNNDFLHVFHILYNLIGQNKAAAHH